MEAIGSNKRTGQALAVVVGAGGLAMAIARRLGNAHRVMVADRDAGHLDRQVVALRSEGLDASGVVCDVTDGRAVLELADAAAGAGPLRALAHVVGVSPSLGDGPTVLRVNLGGPALVMDAFLPLAERGTAAVFVSSLAGHGGELSPVLTSVLDAPLAPDLVAKVEAVLEAELDSTTAYRLSKTALIRLCRRRVTPWAERGARIVSLSPGLIATPQGAREFEQRPDKHVLYAKTPLQREGTMVEIADAVEFLLSDRASFITGIDLLVDGGIAAAVRNEAEAAVAGPAEGVSVAPTGR